jgi:crotonobetainyl-CoA:carnitine CoA-transferase CaiB-like acyl-CoA transferase
MAGPLSGVKIVDLSTVLMAPYATQIMGDMGADVIKIEAPTGDPIRGIGPCRNDGMGAIFLNVNRSKRSIVLDLKSPEGREVLSDLVRRADVLVYNLRPQVMARLGLSYEAMASANRRIIYAGMFGYGQNGPYANKPAYDDLIQGVVGIPWLTHVQADVDPVYVPTAIVDRGVALSAVGLINAALYHQAKTGEGQRIDIPMFETMAGFVLGDHLSGRTFEPPIGPAGYPRMLVSDRRPYRTSDGYICAMVYSDRQWRSFYKALGREDAFDRDPRLKDIATRTKNIGDIYSELSALIQTRTTAEWLAFFDAADIPATPLHSLESLIDDPHLKATGFFKIVDHPSEGLLRQIGIASIWSSTNLEANRQAPLLGEHSAEVLREIGYSDERIDALMQAGITSGPGAQTTIGRS